MPSYKCLFCLATLQNSGEGVSHGALWRFDLSRGLPLALSAYGETGLRVNNMKSVRDRRKLRINRITQKTAAMASTPLPLSFAPGPLSPSEYHLRKDIATDQGLRHLTSSPE